MRRQLARAIVRVYPRAWRRRYGAELLTLLEEQPPSLGQAIDLLRGCCSEWRMSVPRGERPSIAVGLVLAATRVTAAFGVSGIVALNGTMLGLALRIAAPEWTPPPSLDWAFLLDGLLLLRLMAALSLRPIGAGAICQPEVVAWAAVMIAAATLRVWSGAALAPQFMHNAVWFMVVSLSARRSAESARA